MMRKLDYDYRAETASDAADMAREFADQITEQLADKGHASDDYNNDYAGGDEYHHQSHVDKEYCLRDAALLLDQLSEFEESDSGLWEGQAPKEAVATMAAFTYGAAVASMFGNIIEKINEDYSDLSDELDAEESACEERRDRLNELEAKENSGDTLSDDEQTELAALVASSDSDDEDAFIARKRAAIKEYVESKIAEWEK